MIFMFHFYTGITSICLSQILGARENAGEIFIHFVYICMCVCVCRWVLFRTFWTIKVLYIVASNIWVWQWLFMKDTYWLLFLRSYSVSSKRWHATQGGISRYCWKLLAHIWLELSYLGIKTIGEFKGQSSSLSSSPFPGVWALKHTPHPHTKTPW